MKVSEVVSQAVKPIHEGTLAAARKHSQKFYEEGRAKRMTPRKVPIGKGGLGNVVKRTSDSSLRKGG